MDAAWADHDARHGFDRDDLAIDFEVTFAFEDDVDLGHLLVVVELAVHMDVREVDAGQIVPGLLERPAGFSAGAGNRRDFIQLGNGESFLRHDRSMKQTFWKATARRSATR